MSDSKRKGKMLEEEEEEGELWLLSYADMMTLVACFFILMMAFAHYDPVGFTEKTKVVAQHFNKDKFKNSMTKMDELTEEIAKHPKMKDMTKITVHDSEVIINFSSTVLFEDGGWTLTPEVSLLLDSMIDIIKTLNENYQIIVEGHSDNGPIPKNIPFKSHWALAGARAASVIERFEYFGFDPKNLRAVSHGDTRPVLPNTDKKGLPLEENIRMNRRVVIKVIKPLKKTEKKYKLGLGVYFD
ncbi:MAG: OmpA family protein [Halobacteriovoraceae bacterium]|nr:OmpA family protein [Halobacteriovoraceae bacterium]